MSAATRRSLLLCLESLEPNLRTAGERAARRAGLELGDWIALRLRDGAPRGSETCPPSGGPAGTPDEAPSRRSRIDLDDLAALRSAVEEIRLAPKHPRPARSDPETVRRLRSVLAKLETLDDGRSSVDLSAAARRIEDAAGRSKEPAELPRDGPAAVARPADELARCLEAVARRRGGRDELGSIARLLEALHARLEERERAGPDLLDRVERLTAQLDRMAQDHGSTLARSTERLLAAAGAPASDHSTALQGLAERLDRLDERLRECGSRDEARLQPIEAMLRAVVDRLGQASTDEDPPLASLQRTMDDLLARTAALGGGTPGAVERPAEATAVDAPDRAPMRGAPAVGSSPADAADGRVRETLEAAHRAMGAASVPPGTDGKAERLSPVAAGESPSERCSHGTPPIRLDRGGAPALPAPPDERERSPPADEAAAAPEPNPEGPHGILRAPARPGTADAAVGDIKAGLIAAARRAAQVAAAEAADRPGDVRPSEDPLPAAAGGSARARLRSAVERHRRSLILGLAAVILGLGALQIGSRGVKEPEPDAVPSPAAGPVPQTPAPPAGTRPGSPVGTVRPEGARKVEASPGLETPAFLGAEDVAETLAPRPIGEWTQAGPRLKKATGARA
jgi:localization factor PodJL